MTDKEIQQRLKNFDGVWKRVQKSKKLPGSAKLMPGKGRKAGQSASAAAEARRCKRQISRVLSPGYFGHKSLAEFFRHSEKII